MSQTLYEVHAYNQYGQCVGVIRFKDQATFNSYPKNPNNSYIAKGFVPVSDYSILAEVNASGHSEMQMLVG